MMSISCHGRSNFWLASMVNLDQSHSSQLIACGLLAAGIADWLGIMDRTVFIGHLAFLLMTHPYVMACRTAPRWQGKAELCTLPAVISERSRFLFYHSSDTGIFHFERKRRGLNWLGVPNRVRPSLVGFYIHTLLQLRVQTCSGFCSRRCEEKMLVIYLILVCKSLLTSGDSVLQRVCGAVIRIQHVSVFKEHSSGIFVQNCN